MLAYLAPGAFPQPVGMLKRTPANYVGDDGNGTGAATASTHKPPPGLTVPKLLESGQRRAGRQTFPAHGWLHKVGVTVGSSGSHGGSI